MGGAHLLDPIGVGHLVAQLHHLCATAARGDGRHLVGELPDQRKRALLHVRARGSRASERELRRVLRPDRCDEGV